MGSLILQQPAAPRLDWGVALQAQPGQLECGDAWIIEPISDGFLVAVIDGLGHGAAAALAAQLAVDAIRSSVLQPLEVIVSVCHQALLRSRGAALSLARIDTSAESLTWVGIGNVEGLVLDSAAFSLSLPHTEALVARGGVVGYDVPTLRPTTLPFKPGSFLIFATDGVKPGFAAGMRTWRRAQQAADDIFATHRRGTDDALVMVIQLVKGGPDED